MGQTVYHAFVLYDVDGLQSEKTLAAAPIFVSNAVALELQ
jgi:hypothetical protein